MPTNPQKKHYTMTLKDFYKEFKRELRVEKEELKYSYARYREIMEDFFMECFKRMIHENFLFMMPYSLGTIAVKSFNGNRTNLKKRKIDWKKTKEYGTIVRHLNTHTFGYYFGIMWDKSYVRFRNNAYYVFRATSSDYATRNGVGKKALSKHIRNIANDPNAKSYIKI